MHSKMRVSLMALCLAGSAVATLITPVPAAAGPCIIVCGGPCVLDNNTGVAQCQNCSFTCNAT